MIHCRRHSRYASTLHSILGATMALAFFWREIGGAMRVLHVDESTIVEVESIEYDRAERSNDEYETLISGQNVSEFSFGGYFYTVMSCKYLRADIAHMPPIDWPDWFR